MAQQGWYPDPGGQAGMFRYWDGQTWSPTISPVPLPGPPTPAGGPAVPSGPPPLLTGATGASAPSSAPDQGGYDPTQPLAAGRSSAYYQSPQATQGAYSQFQAMGQAKPKKPVGLWVILVVGLVALALIVWFIASRIAGGSPDPGPTQYPVGNPTDQVCPTSTGENVRGDHPSDDGWVYGGQLAYPELGDPWSAVRLDDYRIPFGRDVAEQIIPIHPNYTADSSWVASVMVGQLYAGDGFFAPEEASQIVNRCIFGVFYGDAEVKADTQRSEAYTLDGKQGWITETNLSFSIPNLPTTSELAIVIIVQTGQMTSSIFYASIPNDAMQYEPDVRQAIAKLKVVE